MKRGDIQDLVIEDLTLEGRGIARWQGLVVLVRGAVPGDTARVQCTGVRRNFAEADILEILHASTLRTPPRCRHFGPCGGCTRQHLNYEGQLALKRQHVADTLERIGGFVGHSVPAVLGAREPYFYRNKMEFSFGDRWRTRQEMENVPESNSESSETALPYALGLHIPGRFDRVLDLKECWLQSETSSHIVNTVRAFCLEQGIPAYSTRTHSGYLRNLVIRQSRRTGEMMVNLVTKEDRPEIMASFVRRLLESFPSLTTIVNNINTRKSQVAVGERERVSYGPGTITERIGNRTYRISANSFFQTNTEQAERLYDVTMQLAQLRPTDVVYDLYSGIGTIALHIADHVRQVIGIESVQQAVDDARRNASSNAVTNCEFLHGDLKDTLVGARKRGTPLTPPDVVIVDPPRAGLHEKVATEICLMNPRRIVYVSCNAATQARDLKIICQSFEYSINGIQPVDMFPQTSHIENIVALDKSRR